MQCERIICDDQMKEAEQLINKYSPNKKWEKVFGIKLPLVRLWLKQGKLPNGEPCFIHLCRNKYNGELFLYSFTTQLKMEDILTTKVP